MDFEIFLQGGENAVRDVLARGFGIGGQQQGGHQQGQGVHQGPPPGGFQGGGGGGGNFRGGPQGGGGNNYGGPGPNNFGEMQGGGRDEQQKKVDQKEKGEKNVDCCHDKEDCPRQGRDSKSVDLVRNIQALTKRSVGEYHANFLQILYLAIHQVVSYQNVLFT